MKLLLLNDEAVVSYKPQFERLGIVNGKEEYETPLIDVYNRTHMDAP